MVGRARSLAGHGLLLLRSVVHPLFTFEKALRLTIRDKVGGRGGQPGPSQRKAAMTITDDIYRLWCALAPAARMSRSAQHEPGTDTPSGKHRAESSRRPYAPVGRTGRRIYRSPSHRA